MAYEKHIVIIGGGFGGLNAAKSLAPKLKSKRIKITLIDKNNYHLFQPFLYQVAACELSYSDIAAPLRMQFREYKDVSILIGEVIRIDVDQRSVTTFQGIKLTYDYLIVATGSKNHYFGHEKWQDYTLGLKDLNDAINIRNTWIKLFENIELELQFKNNETKANCVIIGGGPTGVEAAGSMLEFIKYCRKQNFTHVTKSNINLFLIEAGPHLLPSFTEKSSKYTEKALRNLGAIIKLGTKVESIKPRLVTLSNGESIKADMIIWAAGVEASNINQVFTHDIEVGKGGRIKVNKDLSLPNYPEIFVIGDTCESLDENGNPLPGLAAVATQQGKFVAKVILQRISGNIKKIQFKYKNLGNLAIIGRYHGIAEFYKLKFYGLIGWVIWDLAHIYFLIGIRNRLIVFIKWLWAYFTRYKGEQTILERNEKNNK